MQVNCVHAYGQEKKRRLWFLCECIANSKCGDRMSRNIHFIGEVPFFPLSLLSLLFSISFVWTAVHVNLITVSFGCSKHFFSSLLSFTLKSHTVASFVRLMWCRDIHSIACLCRCMHWHFFASTHRTAYAIRVRQTPSHHRQMELNENILNWSSNHTSTVNAA